MSDSIELPSYKEQSAAVRERFADIYKRPIKLEVKGISKSFTTAKGTIDVLSPINFNVHRREFISVIGPSGCGKSTLIRMLAG